MTVDRVDLRRRWTLAAGLVTAAALSAALWPAAASSSGESKKTYTAAISVSPVIAEDDSPADAAGEVWAGAAPRVGLTITNSARNPQTLGSANVGLPAGIAPVAGSTAITSAVAGFAGTAALDGTTLRLRNLNLPPGASVTATVLARVTCAPSAAAYPLTTAVKQSNDFNGTGNDFMLSGSVPALDAVGRCSLVFTTQPASAQRETDITGDVFLPLSATPPGSPVAVRVTDGSGAAPVTWWSAPVSLSLASNPGGAALHGSTSATPVSGTATFDDPSAAERGPRIGVSASGYRLSAESAGITSTPPASSAFDIVDVGRRCTAGQTCPGSSASTRSAADVTATATNTGDLLRLSLGAPGTAAPVCAGYTTSTDTLDFDLTTSTGAPSGGPRTITFTLLAAYATRPASKYDACFQSVLPFTTKSGAPAAASGGTYTGLLPDCPCGTPSGPCEKSTVRRTNGDIVMTILAPPGDPRARF